MLHRNIDGYRLYKLTNSPLSPYKQIINVPTACPQERLIFKMAFSISNNEHLSRIAPCNYVKGLAAELQTHFSILQSSIKRIRCNLYQYLLLLLEWWKWSVFTLAITVPDKCYFEDWSWSHSACLTFLSNGQICKHLLSHNVSGSRLEVIV